MQMGRADAVTKAYMRKNRIFADAFNYLIYDGKAVVDPEKLTEVDTTEIALPFGGLNADGVQGGEAVQRYRDVLKSAVVMQEEQVAYILFGIENQTAIHYAMPVRNMIYDALRYGSQVAECVKHRRNDHDRRCKRGEYLSGFSRDDRLRPVITLVIHFGADRWDGPLSLHEMMTVRDERLLSFVQDYRIHLIDPARLTKEDLEKFSTSLREVMACIKYSKDKAGLSAILKDNPRMIMEREAALVIREITNTRMTFEEGAEVVDVCKAVEEMMLERENLGIEKGIEQGELRMLRKQIQKGRLTPEQAAEDANMTLEEFEKAIEGIS